MKRIVLSVIMALSVIASTASLVHAISNPDSIAFGTGSTPAYAVFTNVHETGDMLFIAEGYVNYAVIPTDYTASQAFVFEVLNTAGNVTMLSTPLVSYGDRPIGIYQTNSQVIAEGLSSGTAYVIRIRGNPMIFASGVGNTVSATLGAGDYFDDSNVVGGLTPLRNFVINTILANMQVHDGVTTYKQTILGVQYATTSGGDLLLAGVPGLDTLEPSIFSASNQALSLTQSSGNGTYGASLTPASVWGTSTANALTALSNLMGMGDNNGGLILLWVVGIVAAIGIGTKVGSPLVVLMLLALTPLFGALLGLMNLAAAFTIAISIIIIGALLFFRNVTIW